MSDIHVPHMQRCIALALKGLFTARPNPVVGSIIARNGQVIAEGWHAVAGQAHAEINALNAAGEAARGATLYVTLEPCAHQGRTGPCCEAIIAAGISTVVYGMEDPNPEVSGRGLARLRAAGITVTGPVLEAECAALNPGFIKRMREQLPYVRCKLAMSLDGRTAMADGESKWITGSEAREDVQHWRAQSSAILTGIGTLLADDPGLDVRLDGFGGEQPLRVVLDTGLRTPPTAKTLQLPGRVLLVTAGTDRAHADYPANTSILACPGSDGRIDLQALLHHLAVDRQCNEVLLEAGATLSGAMLQAGLIDELLLYIAPKLLGDQARPLFRLPGLNSMAEQIGLEIMDVRMFGKDCRMRTRLPET